MNDDYDDVPFVETFTSSDVQAQPKRRGRPPKTAQSTAKKPDYKAVVDMAVMGTGLICLTFALETELAPNRLELEAVLVPLLNIISRRTKILTKVNQDTEDVLLIVMGIITYVSRVGPTIAYRRELRKQSKINPALATPESSPNTGHSVSPQNGLDRTYESLVKRARTEG